MRYTVAEIERVARVAFEAARGRRRTRDVGGQGERAGGLAALAGDGDAGSAAEYPDVRLEHLYVDYAAMRLVANPAAIDVLLTENLFGDILSDEAAVLTGSLGPPALGLDRRRARPVRAGARLGARHRRARASPTRSARSRRRRCCCATGSASRRRPTRWSGRWPRCWRPALRTPDIAAPGRADRRHPRDGRAGRRAVLRGQRRRAELTARADAARLDGEPCRLRARAFERLRSACSHHHTHSAAQPVPSSRPASTSVGQCTPRYTREKAMRSETHGGQHEQRDAACRRGQGADQIRMPRPKTSGASVAWPEGKE